MGKSKLHVGVIGLGKLGSVLAALLASSGHDVIGVDTNPDVVASLNAGQAPFHEPGLGEELRSLSGSLTAYLSIPDSYAECGVTYIIVPTPSNTDGSFSNDYLIDVLRTIGHVLRGHDRHHTIVVASTVSPGAFEGKLMRVLEEASQRKIGENVGLVYSPEFIALGSIVSDMRLPDLILIGESDEYSGSVAQSLALGLVLNQPQVHRMSLASAEVVKLAINSFVTMKISFANSIGEICEALKNADSSAVLNAVGADSRVGGAYLRSATGFGGPCFPRDNRALAACAQSVGVQAALAAATDAINDRQVFRRVSQVVEATSKGGVVAVLGLAYKPDTPVCEMSQGVMVANALASRGFRVLAFDPMADPGNTLDDRVQLVGEAKDALDPCETVILMTPWKDFSHIDLEVFGQKKVIDPWGLVGVTMLERAE